MNLRSWISHLVRPKPVKYASSSDWATEHFPTEKREVAARVADVLVDRLNVRLHDLNESTRFINDLQMDDLEPAEVLMDLESAFRFSIPDEDSQNLETISDLVLYLYSRSQPISG